MLDRLKKELLFFDGAMGTQLQQAGLKAGAIPEELNIDDPELITSIHEKYLAAGADFITTNTFGCNKIKMAESKYDYQDMIKAAVVNARDAQKRQHRENDSYIALDIGPIGTMLKPVGTLSFDEAYDIIASQVKTVKDEVDVVLLETMNDLYEVKAGILAAKENSNLPVFVTMTFQDDGRTLMGVDPLTFVNVVEGLNADALGVNCSLGPKELKPIVEEILSYAHIPVIVQPNAGLPVLKNGETYYQITPEEFCESMIDIVDSGASIVGGCCGTSPEFIKLMNQRLPKVVHVRENPYYTAVSSQNKTVVFDDQVVICGERLNPTGRKKMKQALKEERYEEIVVEAIKEDQAGADVLDVNVGLPDIDESKAMEKLIPMLQEVINLPLQIDSSAPAAIEKACRYYNGKPLINSVNGKDEVMEDIFPIVKKYGGVVIGLTLEKGIPKKARERVDIAKKIINKAERYGIRKENIMIDCLTLTASAQQKEVNETIKAVSQVKQGLGMHTVLGVSNVSFGLPNRSLLNRTFLTMALQAGLDMPIMNPLDLEMMAVVDAFNVLTYKDQDSLNYIENHADDKASTTIQKKTVNKQTDDANMDLYQIILKGLKDEVKDQTKIELKEKDALMLINETIIPALNQVGKDYETGKIFLPQLMQSAETSKVAFDVVQESFPKNEDEKKGPILMGTVEGDIHDIGKNIVKVVLESYGYDVIDLGKDVPVDTVIEAYQKYHPKAIGLSALMTTTVVNMEKTIKALHGVNCDCPIWVGGAVLTQDIADDIGADYYTEDAMATVRLLNDII